MNADFMRSIAAKGGRAGTGLKKVRGTSEYYRNLSLKRFQKKSTSDPKKEK